MTKEHRVNVIDQINDVHDLKIGDRISMKCTKGSDLRMNSAFTFGGLDGGFIVTIDGARAVSIKAFLITFDSWDTTEWQVWRKPAAFPTEVGSIIWIGRSLEDAPVGLYRRNRQGGFTSLDRHEVVIWCNQIKSWANVDITITTED